MQKTTIEDFIECKTEFVPKFVRKWVILNLHENTLHFSSQLEDQVAGNFALQDANVTSKKDAEGNFLIELQNKEKKLILNFLNNETQFKRWLKLTKGEGTNYVEREDQEISLESGTKEQSLEGESQNIIFALLKQVTVGMDLSKISLPTFILEPKSMLEKISDFLTHAELLSKANTIEDPLQRMIAVTKWYLSGFYIKPKGVKKPYNPILGELFRCRWNHKENNSKTFFVSEQVSHHPPISAFYASNRKDGFTLNGSILFKSRFYGSSVGSILEGSFTLSLLGHDEDYEITFPSAYAKGFLYGTLWMELIGVVNCTCKKTGINAIIDFRQKPMIGGDYNQVFGTIKVGDEVRYSIQGKWDSRIDICPGEVGYWGNEELETLWEPTPEVVKNRVPKCKPLNEEMKEFESEKLWSKVSKAIIQDDQTSATLEKHKLEQIQRDAAKERQEKGEKWIPRYFVEKEGGRYEYKYLNKEKWDVKVDIEEVEKEGIVYTVKRMGNIQTPPIASTSVVSYDLD